MRAKVRRPMMNSTPNFLFGIAGDSGVPRGNGEQLSADAQSLRHSARPRCGGCCRAEWGVPASEIDRIEGAHWLRQGHERFSCFREAATMTAPAKPKLKQAKDLY